MDGVSLTPEKALQVADDIILYDVEKGSVEEAASILAQEVRRLQRELRNDEELIQELQEING